jgi:hypothetical protein
MDLIMKAIEAKLASAGMDWLKLQSLQLRPKEKRLTAELLLEGESAPVAVELTYAVEGDFLKVVSLQTSKKWLTEVASLALAKTAGQIELPSGLKGRLVKFFL